MFWPLFRRTDVASPSVPKFGVAPVASLVTSVRRLGAPVPVESEAGEAGHETELILVAFRTLLLLFLTAAPLFLSVREAYTRPAVALLVLGGAYNIAMGVACLFPGRFGVRRPLIVAMDAVLITAWLHFSHRWEIVSFYFVVVVVAATWGRVFGGVLAAIASDFAFLFLWGRSVANLNPDGAVPLFPASLGVHAVLLFVVGALAGYIAEAQERERERRLERELLIANYQQEIELSGELQPTLLTPLQTSGLADVGVATRSARQFGGGDFLDVLPLPDGKILLCIADVAGKSVRAQARVPLLKYSLRALAPLYPAPCELMTHLQNALAPDLSSELYIAVCLVEFDPVARRLSWCNAGHVPPLLVFSSDAERLSATGPALGLFPEILPQGKTRELPRGADLLLYTDGLTDALSLGGGADGEVQLEKLAVHLLKETDRARSEVARLLVEHATTATDALSPSALARLGGKTAKEDDVAVLIARFEAPEGTEKTLS